MKVFISSEVGTDSKLRYSQIEEKMRVQERALRTG